MTESKKEEASVAKTQKKSAISDDFGSDFLSSWKTMSVTEDDGLDFNQEVLPKGKKNMFNFDKLDMDFSLDGDFGKKMSSFNVDMSDLDFSSPAKKPSKAKEGSTEESLDGKQGGKQSRFNLSFDFNELDNFDFDSNFMKGKSKSEKAADLKGFDSPRKPEKNPSAQHKPAAGVDSPENSNADKTPVSQHLSTSKFEDLDGIGKFKANISSSSTSADFGMSSQSHSTASPMKQTTVSTKETSQSSQRSERTYSTEQNMQNTIQGSSSQSFSMEGSLQEAALTQGEVCSSATEDKTSQEVAPDINLKGCDNESSQPVHISGQKNAENESKKMLEKKSDVRMGVTSGDNSMQGDMNINDSSAGDSVQKMLHGTVSAKETYVKSKLDFEVLQSEGKVHQPEKETVDIQREYSTRSVGTETQLNPSAPKKACSVSGEKTENVLHLADAKSKSKDPQPAKPKESGIQSKHPSASIGANTQLNTQSTPKKAGSVSNRKEEKLHLGSLNARSEPKARQLVKEKESSTGQSKYFNKSVETETRLNSQSTSEKERHVSNKRNDNMHSNPADLVRQEHPAIDAEVGNHRINTSKSQEWEVKKGAFVALGNGKNGDTKETSSRLPEKTVKSAAPQSLNSKLVSSISRIRNLKNNSVEGNKLPPLHTAKTTLEASSLKVSRLAAISHPKTLTTIKSPKTSTVNIEKRILISPHTKRKTPEAPEPDPVMLPPLKRRPTPSPNQCRGLEETSKRLDKKMVHSSPIPDVPRDESWKELQQVPLLMEDDGNIEKAEAHSKELEDICNMLKKRHDEAKELLVRAIVNNNKLLMLNHPVYVEKIRMVERFANLVLSPTCQI